MMVGKYLKLLFVRCLVIDLYISKLKFLSKIMLANIGVSSPFEMNFAITYKCNSRCEICNIWKQKSENELSLKEIEKFSKKIDFIQWIRLTGGEPFLRKDYADIVKLLNKNILDLILITTPTNGHLTDLIYENVKKVLEFFEKNYVITVSLDGPKAIHEKIRGIKGSWNKSIETYKKLKELEKEHKNFKVFFGYTISPSNVGFFEKTLEEVKKIISEIDVNDFHVNLFQTSGIYYKNLEKEVGKDYSKKSQKEIDIILNLRGNSINPMKMIETRYLKLGKDYLKTKEMPIDCNIFKLSCFVDPFGNVYPCTIFERKIGNLRNNNYDLKKILESENARIVNKEIIEKKCPKCWTPCEAHQMIVGKLIM
jgi:MoaA/NifB/PqqE/SkfB family radical SAM enzyme